MQKMFVNKMKFLDKFAQTKNCSIIEVIDTEPKKAKKKINKNKLVALMTVSPE